MLARSACSDTGVHTLTGTHRSRALAKLALLVLAAVLLGIPGVAPASATGANVTLSGSLADGIGEFVPWPTSVSVAGTVRDETGEPIQPDSVRKAYVSIFTADGTYMRTDPVAFDGAYSVLAWGYSSGDYYLEVNFAEGSPYSDFTYPGPRADGSEGTFHLEVERTKRLDLTAHHTPTISGVVSGVSLGAQCSYMAVALVDTATGQVVDRMFPFGDSTTRFFLFSTEGLVRGLYTVAYECITVFDDVHGVVATWSYAPYAHSVVDASKFLAYDGAVVANVELRHVLDPGFSFFTLSGWSPPSGEVLMTIRDESGAVTRSGSFPVSGAEIRVTASGVEGPSVAEFTADGYAPVSVAITSLENAVRVTASAGSSVTGKVVQAGAPVKDVAVSLIRTSDWSVYQPGIGFVPWEEPPYVISDGGSDQTAPASVDPSAYTLADGTFTIPNVASRDDYVLYISGQYAGVGSNYLGGGQWRDDASVFAVAADTDLGTISLPGTGTVTGRVYWGATGHPQQFFVFQAYAQRAAGSSWDLVDWFVYSREPGDSTSVDYRMDLPPGTYRIAVANVSDSITWSRGLSTSVYPGVAEIAAGTSVSVTAGTARSGVNFALSTMRPVASSRYAGGDRYGTAVEMSKTFSPGVPVVYVASGEAFPDALAAAPAAAAQGGPLLTVRKNGVPAAVKAELDRLKPASIVVVGGTAAVSKQAYDELSSYAGAGGIRRVSGADRYATARAVVADCWGRKGASTVFVASGRNFPDALSAAAAAGAIGMPVVTVDGHSAPSMRDYAPLFAALKPSTVVIAGGRASVDGDTEVALRGFAGVSEVVRRAGADRYSTAADLNYFAFDRPPVAYIASGRDFPDALAGAALAGRDHAPLYIVPGDCFPSIVIDDINTKGIGRLKILGGKSAVSVDVRDVRTC